MYNKENSNNGGKLYPYYFNVNSKNTPREHKIMKGGII